LIPNPAEYEDLIIARERQLARVLKVSKTIVVGAGFWTLEEAIQEFRDNECEPIVLGNGIEDRLLRSIVQLDEELGALWLEAFQCRLFDDA
jgi:hypothetical protein